METPQSNNQEQAPDQELQEVKNYIQAAINENLATKAKGEDGNPNMEGWELNDLSEEDLRVCYRVIKGGVKKSVFKEYQERLGIYDPHKDRSHWKSSVIWSETDNPEAIEILERAAREKQTPRQKFVEWLANKIVMFGSEAENEKSPSSDS